MSSIHLELLDAKRKNAFIKLKIFKDEGILAGGTALMLQYVHRYSFDFDIFFSRPLKLADHIRLRQNFEIEKTTQNNEDQITVTAKSGVEITLLHYYFRPLFKTVSTNSLSLSSLKDIMADKAETVGRRAVWRDYFDLFYFLKNKFITLEEIIRNAKQKFGVEFNPSLFLEQLTYFDDLKDFNLAYYKKKYSRQEIKDFLTHQAEMYTKKILKI